MAVGNIIRRLRGVAGNALVWGGGWFAATFAVLAMLRIFDFAPPGSSWGDGLRFALRSGVMGAIAGTAFSSFITLRYQGRRLSDISWLRFGIGGAVVTGLFVPAFLVVARLLSGDDFLPLSALLRNGLFGAVFGGAAAGASLKLAQLAHSPLPSPSHDPPDLLEGADHPAATEARDSPRRRAPAQRSTED
jgi:hypothetical protein